MKIKLFFISLFLSFFSFSQEQNFCGKIIYEQIVNFDYEYIENYELTFTKNWSYAEEINIVNFNDKKLSINNSNGLSNAVIVGRKNKTPKYYYNTINDFFFRDNYSNHILIVKEEKNFTNWKLHNKTKNIGGFICNKATIKFRGRNYIAWYTNKIPLPFGPWKARNLPGLILEFYDTDNVFHIYTKKISILKDNKCAITIAENELNTALDIVNYNKTKEKIIDDVFKKLSSKQPKGSKPIKRDKNCTDCRKTIEVFK